MSLLFTHLLLQFVSPSFHYMIAKQLSSLFLSPFVSFSFPPTEWGLFLPRMPLLCLSAPFTSTGCCFRLHHTHTRTHSYLHKRTHTHLDTRFTSMQNGGGLCSWRLTRRRERDDKQREDEEEEGKGQEKPMGQRSKGEVSDTTCAGECVHTHTIIQPCL